MPDVTRDPAALERLRVQRSRLADRMRPPWWYLTGSAILWAVLFAGPFILQYLLHGVPTWPRLILLAAAIVVAPLAVAAQVTLLQARLRGIRQELRDGGAAA